MFDIPPHKGLWDMKEQETCFEGVRKLLQHFAGRLSIMIDHREIRILPTCCITDKMVGDFKHKPWWVIGDKIIGDWEEQYTRIHDFILQSQGVPGRGTMYVRYYPPGFRTDKRFAGDCFPGIRTSISETIPEAVTNSLVEAVCKFQKYILIREVAEEFDFNWYVKGMDDSRKLRVINEIGLFGMIGKQDLENKTYFKLLQSSEECGDD